MKRAFYSELGIFICSFASVEQNAHLLFRRVSGLNDDQARKLIHGMELAKLLEVIKSLSALLPDRKLSAVNKKEIENLVQQINSISPLRNTLVHGGANIENDEVLSVNFRKAKSSSSIQQTKLQLNDLQNASLDLRVIAARLKYLVRPHRVLREDIFYFRRQPWLYKSLPTSNWSTQFLVNALERYRPPQSFLPKPG